MDYGSFRDLATDLISDFGNAGQATFTRTAIANFDPLTDRGTVSTTTHSALVVALPDSDKSLEEARALGWDVKVMTPATGFTPEAGDQVTLPGRAGAFVVVAPVEMMAPDGEPIAFTVRLRKGS